jgi:hypothetical protein
MVEHAAVNRVVVGSSPTSGAIFKPLKINGSLGEKTQKSPNCQRKCQRKSRFETAQANSGTTPPLRGRHTVTGVTRSTAC